MKVNWLYLIFRYHIKAMFLLVLMQGCSLLPAQTDYSWYRHYVLDSMEIVFPSGLEQCEMDAVLILASKAQEVDPPVNRSSLVRIDGKNGDILWSTPLTHNLVAEGSELFFFIRGLIRLKDGSYIVLVDTITEGGESGFAIHRIASDGSVIWQMDYGIAGQQILANLAGLSIGADSMSFAISARRLDIENPSSSLILFHIDENGEILKDLNLNTGLQFYWELSPITMLADSSFVVGLNLGSIDISATKLLRRISYDGQTLATHTAWDFGWWSDLRRHPSGQLVAVSQSFSGAWENRESHGLRTTLYNSDLDTIWSRVYNHFEGPLYYRETDFPGGASFDGEGNILISGDGSAYNGIRPAHLIMYNINGEIRWNKRLGIKPDLAGHVQSIGGNIAFQTNGVLLSGTISVNEILLIRLDSTGCIIEPDCGTDYLLNTDNEDQKTVFNFLLTPNPAGDQVIVSFSQDQFQLLKNPKIHIFDLIGNVMATFQLSGPGQHLDLYGLPPGLYVVMLESAGSLTKAQKLIKW